MTAARDESEVGDAVTILNHTFVDSCKDKNFLAKEDEPDVETQQQTAEITENYRLKPVRLNIKSIADVLSQEFVENQTALLQEDLIIIFDTWYIFVNPKWKYKKTDRT